MTPAKRLILMGRIYSNLLGSMGDCESTDGWTPSNASAALDSDNKYAGTHCIKITKMNQYTARIYYDIYSLLDKAKYYLISVYLKNGTLATGMTFYMKTIGGSTLYGSTVGDINYSRIGILVKPDNIKDSTANTLIIFAEGDTVGQAGYMDSIMINEITADDYASGITACLEKYPYKGA